jgi:hypothetical protein
MKRIYKEIGPKEATEILKGRTIERIVKDEEGSCEGWPFCIEEIHFSGGVIAEFSGAADRAWIDYITIIKTNEKIMCQVVYSDTLKN